MHEGRSRKKRIPAFVLAMAMAISLLCPAWAAPSERTVIPLGKAVGIKLFADGVLVVDVSDMQPSPAISCGLKKGDIIQCIDGESIRSTEQVQELLQEGQGKAVTVSVRRGGNVLQMEMKPAQCSDGVYRLGAWIRDSMAGVGTLTYYDPTTGSFGALGHGITDVDTAQLLPLHSGSIMETQIKAVRRGEKGEPGELKGDFSVQKDVGTLCANTESGIFGALSEEPSGGEAIPVATADQVKTGKATILSTVSGEETREYTVEILKIYPDNQPTRNLLLQVTDPELLKVTGGIVQGMSGSPILQNGKLVGAVTHVLLKDATRGYGIFAENMLRTAT